MMADVSHAWFNQATRDLEVARSLLDNSYFEWACYASQQAAEKAIKSVYIHLGASVDDLKKKSHKLNDMMTAIKDLCERDLSDIVREASLLEPQNQKTRYPEREVPPMNSYNVGTARSAIRSAEKILQYCNELRIELETFWAEH